MTAKPRKHTGIGWSRREFMATSLSMIAGSALAACGGSTAPLQGPRLTARPGTPTEMPTLGQSALGLGSDRDGFLYVPQSYTGDTALPLFVGLHGAGGSGHSWDTYQARAESRGMILLAPDSRGRTWDLSLLGNYGPDVTFLDEALAYTFARCRIDATHIVLGGFSDGASYTLCLGVSNGDLFTNLIAYSPGYYAPRSPIVGRPPVFVSHGTLDPVLPFYGTQSVIVPALRGDGYTVDFQTFPGGHEVPASISELALDWFLGTSAA